MIDPFVTLGLTADVDDAAVRARYLELVRQYPPEHAPERFAAIRAAYDCLAERDGRLRYRLFEAGRHETLDACIEELACRTPRRRPKLTELLAAAATR